MSQLISCEALSAILNQPNTVILDCRADLQDRKKSKDLYLKDHISGAYFADLEEDLSGPVIPTKTGRHPLPSAQKLTETLRAWGITEESNIVVYDQANSMFAARAWWILKWAGLSQVRVLNGGYAAWQAESGNTDNHLPTPQASDYQPSLQKNTYCQAEDLLQLEQNTLLLDARAHARYCGEIEPLDNKAGHIPGALNADFQKNLSPTGHFLPANELKNRFEFCSDKKVICYCGSGVTACHNILAIVEAGLSMPTLYPGSWSEWITHEDHPIATGSEGDF